MMKGKCKIETVKKIKKIKIETIRCRKYGRA
jgi:hypothetical protein